MPAVRTQRAHRDALVCLAGEKYYIDDEPTYGVLEYEINDIDANGTPLERRECDVHLYRPNVLGHSTARTLQPANPCCDCLRVGDSNGPSLLDSTLGPDGSIKIGTPGARLLLQRRRLVTTTECVSARQAAGVPPLPGGALHHLCAEHLRLVQAQSQYLRLPLKVRDWLLRGCCLECAFLCAGEEPPLLGSPLQPRLSVEQAEELQLSLAPMLQLLLYPRGHSDEELAAASFGNEVPVPRDDEPSDGGFSDLIGLPLRGRNWCFECGANTAIYLYKHCDDLSSEWLLCPPCWLALRNRPRAEGQPAGNSVPAGPGSIDPRTMQLYCCLRREMLLRLQILYPRVHAHEQQQQLEQQAVLRPDESRGSNGSGRQLNPAGPDPVSTAGPSRPAGPFPPDGLPTRSAARGHPSPAPGLFPSQCAPEIITEPYNRRIPLPGTHAAEALGLPPPPGAAVGKSWHSVTPPTDAVPYFHGALLRCAPHVSKCDMQLVEEDYAYVVRKEALMALPEERRRELLELAQDHNARGGLVMFSGPMGVLNDPDGGMLDDVLRAMGVCEEGLRSSQAIVAEAGQGGGVGGDTGGSRGGGRAADGRGNEAAKGNGNEMPLVRPLPWTMGAYEWSVKPSQALGTVTGAGGSSGGAGGSGHCSARADAAPSPPLRDHTYGPVQLCCYDMAHRDDFGLGGTPVSVAFEPYQPHNREQQLGDEVNHAHQVDPTTLLRYMCAMISSYGVPTDPRFRQLRELCNSMCTSPAQELWNKLEAAAAAEAETEVAARRRGTADGETLDGDGSDGPIDKADLLAMAQFGAHHEPTLLPVAGVRRKRSAANGTLQAPKRGHAAAVANGGGRKSHGAGGGGGTGADWTSSCRVPLGLKVPVYPLTADDTLFMTSGDLMRLAHRMLMLHGPPWLRDILHERHNDALDFGTCRPADGGLGVFAHFANILERPQLATELATGSHVDRSQPATLMCFACPFAVPPPVELEAQLDNLKRGLNASSAVCLLQRRNLIEQSRLQHPTAPDPQAVANPPPEPLINADLDRAPKRGSVWVVVPGCRLHQLAHAFNKTSKSGWPRNHNGYFTVRFGRDLERLVATCEQRGLPFHVTYHCEGDLLLPGMAAAHAVMPLHCASMKISQDFLAPAGPALRLIWELDVLRQEHHLKWASRRARDPRFRGGAARADAKLAKLWSEERLARAVAEQARIEQLQREESGRQTRRDRERERGQSARRERGTGTGAARATAQGLTGPVGPSGGDVASCQHQAVPIVAHAVAEDLAAADITSDSAPDPIIRVAGEVRVAYPSCAAESCGVGVAGVAREVIQTLAGVDGAGVRETAPTPVELPNQEEAVARVGGLGTGLTARDEPLLLWDGVETGGLPFTASPPPPSGGRLTANCLPLHIGVDAAGCRCGSTQAVTPGPTVQPLTQDRSLGLCRCHERGQEGMDGCRGHEPLQPPLQPPPTAAAGTWRGADSCVGGGMRSQRGMVGGAPGATVNGAVVAPHPALASLRNTTEAVMAGMPSILQSGASGMAAILEGDHQPAPMRPLPGVSPSARVQTWQRLAPHTEEEVRHLAASAAAHVAHIAAALTANPAPIGPAAQTAVHETPAAVAGRDSARHAAHAAASCPVSTRHRVVIPASGTPQRQQLPPGLDTATACALPAHVPPPAQPGAPALNTLRDFPRTTCLPSMAALGLGEYDSDDEAVREGDVLEQGKPATCPLDGSVDRALQGTVDLSFDALLNEGDISVYASNIVTGTDARGANGGDLNLTASGKQLDELQTMDLPPPPDGTRQSGQQQVSDTAATKWCDPVTGPLCAQPLPDAAAAHDAATSAICKWTNFPLAASGCAVQPPGPPARQEAAQIPSLCAPPANEAAGPLLVFGPHWKKERVRGLIRSLLPITAGGCHSQVGAQLLTLAESKTAAASHASALSVTSHGCTATIRHDGGIPGMISMASEAAAVAATAGPCVTAPYFEEPYPAPVPCYQIEGLPYLLDAIHPRMFELSPDAHALLYRAEDQGAARPEERPVHWLLEAPSDPEGAAGRSSEAGRPLLSRSPGQPRQDRKEHMRTPHTCGDTRMEATGCGGGSDSEMEDDLPLASLVAEDRVTGSQGGTRRVAKAGAGGSRERRPAPAGRRSNTRATAAGSDEEWREAEEADEEVEEEREDGTRFEEEQPVARKRQRGGQAAAGRPQGGAVVAKKARSGSGNKAQGRAASRKAAGGAPGQGALVVAMEEDGGGAAAAPQSEWAQALANARDSFLTQSLLVGLALAVSYTLSDLELRKHRAGGRREAVGDRGTMVSAMVDLAL